MTDIPSIKVIGSPTIWPTEYSQLAQRKAVHHYSIFLDPWNLVESPFGDIPPKAETRSHTPSHAGRAKTSRLRCVGSL
jgi:hypothetical protein